MTQVDSTALKQQQREQWGRAAEGWKRHDAFLRERTAPASQRMLELANIAPGHRVLDIACGTGEPALPAARAVGPTGSVLATDQAPEMLEVAREKAQAEGLTNVEFRLVDGEEVDVPEGSFDAATCRWGIMFMPEPVRCLQQAHRALKAGGRMVAATWGPPQENPWVSLPMGIVRKYYKGPPLPAPDAPGSPFSLADASSLKSAFEQAGFHEVNVERLELAMAVYPTAEQWLDQQLDMTGPLQTIFRQLPVEAQEAAKREILEAGPQGRSDGTVQLTGVALLASGTK